MHKSRIMVTFIVTVFSGTPVLAQEAPPSIGGAESACHTYLADYTRLACYDLKTGYKRAEASQANESKWRVSVNKSEMTDDTNIYASVSSEETVSCRFGGAEHPSLLLRCAENTTSIYITTTGCHLASSDYNNYGDVTYRFDDNPPRNQSFKESTDNRALGLWSGGQAIPFIKSMFGHNQLLVRFTPYSDSPVEAKFNIAGAEEAVSQLREACGW